MRQYWRSASGNSMIEVLAAIAVLAMLGGMIVTSPATGPQTIRVDTAATRLVNDLREAQLRTVAEGRRWQVTFSNDPSRPGYMVEHYCGADPHPECVVVDDWQEARHSPPAKDFEHMRWAELPAVTITFTPPDGSVTLVPQPGGDVVTFTLEGLYGSQRRIRVDAVTGRVELLP